MLLRRAHSLARPFRGSFDLKRNRSSRRLKRERERLRRKWHTCAPGLVALALAFLELLACLLTVTNAVIRAEGYLFAIGKQDLLAALHQVFLIEGPGVHEILQHDHEDLIGKGVKIQAQAIGKATGGAGKSELLSRLFRSNNRRGRPEALQRRFDLFRQVDDGTIGHIIQIILHIEHARQWQYGVTIDERICHRVAGGEAARDRYKVRDLEEALRLL